MTSVRERKYVGTSQRKADAFERVTGQAKYAADVYLQGMLHGKVLRSPYPHAKISRLDCSEALKFPGVKAVVTHDDLLSPNNGQLPGNITKLPERIIAKKKTLFDGHAVAAVAAISPDIAEEALNLIQVEYEELPVLTSAIESMQANAPLLHEDLFTVTLGEPAEKPSNVAAYIEDGRGDIAVGFSKAHAIVEETFETHMVHQGYLEPQACVVRVEGDGTINVWTSIQGIFNSQRDLATLFNVPSDRVIVHPMEIGGGFGGKEFPYLEALAIVMSMKSGGRPVKMVMDRSEVFRATGPSSPTNIQVKIGADKEGKLTACYASMVYDAGAFPGLGIAQAALVAFGPYTVENIKVQAYDVVTNKPRTQAYRAPGATPADFAVESCIDMLAAKLNIDPLTFRKINAVSEGDLMPNNLPYNSIGLNEVLAEIESHPHWNSPITGPNQGRGLAVGFWIGGTGISSSVILLHSDGSVTVSTCQVDLAGTRTTMAQMVADLLQIPIENVNVRVVNTSSAPWTDGTWGSRSTWTQSIALQDASEDIISQMKRQVASHLDSQVDKIEYQDQIFYIKDSPDQSMTWKEVAGESIRSPGGPICASGSVTKVQEAPAFAALLVDVEVDLDTGKIKLLRCTCFQDVGCAINPQQVEGQLQGGTTQGIGWALHEYYHYENGVLRNPSWLDYRTATSLDVPMIDTVIIEKPASVGPYGARGVGEVSITPPPAAIANAVYRASGIRLNKLPMSPESVFWAVRRSRES